MSDYIKREDAINRIAKKLNLQHEHTMFEGWVYILKKWLENIPSADVVPHKRGKWKHIIDKQWTGGELYRCSCCNYGYATGAYHEPYEFHYCPNCGADMRGAK